MKDESKAKRISLPLTSKRPKQEQAQGIPSCRNSINTIFARDGRMNGGAVPYVVDSNADEVETQADVA